MVLAGLALWEQCTRLLLEEVSLVDTGLREDSELDVLDWEALLETDLWEQSTQLSLEEVLSGGVSSEELVMVDSLEELDMVDLLVDSAMEAL